MFALRFEILPRSGVSERTPRNPAVVVGGDVNGLGVARSLRHRGVDTAVLTTSLADVAHWARGVHGFRIPQLEGKELIASLLRIRPHFTLDPILIMADELAALTISGQRARLESAYRFVLPSHETVRALADKTKFHKIALASGLPVPGSVEIEQEGDIRELRKLRLPIVVKPADKAAVLRGHGKIDRIQRASTLASAGTACRRILAAGSSAIAQEWIAGPDRNIAFCLFYAGADGSILSHFTGRKLRSDPPELGSTGVCIGAPEIDGLIAGATRHFARQIGFAGLGSLEFKWHPERREFLAIEPTVARTDWQEEIATLCGVNLPYQAYRDAIGLSVEDAPPPCVAAWRSSPRQRWPREEPPIDGLLYDAIFRLDDPLPGLLAIGKAILHRARRLFRAAAELPVSALFRSHASMQ